MKESIITGHIAKPQESREIDFKKFEEIKLFLNKHDVLKITISGVSMQPVLQNKDIILVESIKDLASLKKFDVIIFWQNNILVCHYFWKENKFFQSESLDLNSKIIVTRPLNPLKGYDHPIKMEQILGLVSQAKINWWLRLRIVLNF